MFDRYDHVSPKNHERMRRGAGVGSTNYKRAINSPLPNRDAILKNKHNKRQLSHVLSTFDMGTAVTIDTQYTGVFGHEEADVTIISYVLQALGEGNNVVPVLCDDKDVFVLYCVLDVEEPYCGQVPDADGALGWSGIRQ